MNRSLDQVSAGTNLLDLKPLVRGGFLLPGDSGYDQSRKIFNALIDKHPAAIVKCAGVADVVHTVNFARKNGWPLAVKGGGHNVAGNAICDNGVVIDFSNMRSIRVDPRNQTVRVEPGVTWGEFDHQTQLFDLATPGGLNSTTGVAGFTLGGGIGWLMSKHGLTCDNLISADVVTAEGKLLVATAEENEDLFWGLKGGGGNFGIVTSFEFQLHPLLMILAGPLAYPPEKAEDVIRFVCDFNSDAPDELGQGCAFRPLPDGRQVLAATFCYAGDLQEGEKIVAPARRFGSPTLDKIQERRYEDFQKSLDDLWPHGLYCYWKSGFMKEPSDEAIKVIARFAKSKPSPLSVIILTYHHGLASRIAPDAAAFSHRDRLYNLNIQAQWSDAADTDLNMKWIREFWAAVEPFMTGGVYVNFLSQEGETRVRAAYGDNWGRLVALKNKYDPTNLFRFNQNIKPSGN